MKSVRRAVIDVGTNSIKLLVAEVDRSQVKPLWEESKQTRLGKGFYDSHRLQPDAISRTAQAVAKFAHDAREYQVSGIRVIATSAARDAVNGRELTDAITAASGLRVEVISGDKEADWVFRGVTSDPALGAGASLLLDVGGGSSEFIVGRASEKVFAGSFALGTVRFLQLCPHSDPPTHSELGTCRSKIAEFLRNEVEPKVAPALKRAINEASDSPRLFATGGTATILARMEARLDDFDRQKIESTRLTSKGIKRQVEHLWRLPLEERKKIVGLPKNRADVILAGAVIYEKVLETFGFNEMKVSTRGLRFAALLDQ